MTLPLLQYVDVGGGDCNNSQQQATASVAQQSSHFPAYHQHAQHHQNGAVDLNNAAQRAVSDVDAIRFTAHATSSVPVHPSYHHHHHPTTTLLQNASSVVMRRNLITYPPSTSAANNIQQQQQQQQQYHPGPPPPSPPKTLHYHPHPYTHQHQYQHQHYPAHAYAHGRIIPTPTAAANVNNVNVNHIIINNNNNSEIVNNTNTNTKNSTSFNISIPVGAAIPVRLPFVPVPERPPTHNTNNNTNNNTNSNNNNNIVTAATGTKVNEKHQQHHPVPLNNSDPHKQHQHQQRLAVQSSSTDNSKVEVIDLVDIEGDSCDDESTKSKINTDTSNSDSNSVKPNHSVIIKKSKKRRKTFVEDVTEWRIPSSKDSSEVVDDKYGFIVSSLQKGLDPDLIPIPDHPDNNVNVNEHEEKQQQQQQQQQNDLPSSTKINSNKIKKKKKNRKKKETTTKMEFPKVTDAEFDNRFLEYKSSSDGTVKQKEILVRSLLSFSNNILVMKNNKNCQNIVNKPWENDNNNNNNDRIEIIPDEPPRSKTSSRVGPQYAAEITPKLNNNNNNNDDSVAAAEAAAAADATFTTFENSSTLPGYDTLWDPKLAKEAEERGEDISGFLEGEHELCNHELLFSILHNNDYCVKSARIDYKRVQGLYDGCTSSKLNRDESKKFDLLIKEKQKDFSLISKTLKRKRSDCISHYYVWKTNNRLYPRMKKDWKECEHCFLCDEGGEMIICEECNHSFHKACAKPPLTSVPEGDWFCHLCTEKKLINKRGDHLLSPISSPRGSVGIRRLSVGSKASSCSKSAESGGGLLDGIENSKSTPSGRKTLCFV